LSPKLMSIFLGFTATLSFSLDTNTPILGFQNYVLGESKAKIIEQLATDNTIVIGQEEIEPATLFSMMALIGKYADPEAKSIVFDQDILGHKFRIALKFTKLDRLSRITIYREGDIERSGTEIKSSFFDFLTLLSSKYGKQEEFSSEYHWFQKDTDLMLFTSTIEKDRLAFVMVLYHNETLELADQSGGSNPF